MGGAPPASLRHRLALALAVVATALALPSAARAAETVINFDDQPAHTTVASQYASQGLTLDQRPSGPAELHPFIEAPPSGQARSSPNVLDISHGCGSEFTYAELWGRFAAPRSYVRLFVGNVYPETIAETQQITLQGYDLGGNAIPGDTDTVSFTGLGVNTEAVIYDPESQISFFGITSPDPTFCPVAIDDLAFEEVPGTIPPDFGLSAQGPDPTLTPGGSANVPLRLNRTSTSVGPISLNVSGLPTGVKASVAPNPTSGGDGSSLTLTLTAEPDAPPESGAPVSIVGSPSPTAGTQPREARIHVSVSGTFDLRAQGLEVTQGVQPTVHALVPSGGESGGNYSGVDLIAHKRTAVRLFADAHGEHVEGGIGGVDALLFGFRNGQQLPESPLHPDYGPAKLTDTGNLNPAPVFEWERQQDAHNYTFTLPDSWAWGDIRLVGRVFQQPTFPTSKQELQCSSSVCQANDSFTENGISFHPTQDVMLTTVALQDNGHLPASAASEMLGPKLVSPLADSGHSWKNPNAGFTVLPYEGTIDISDIINGTGKEKGVEIKGLVDQWASDMGHPNFATMGIAPGDRSEFRADTGDGTSAVVSEPIVAAHELFHLFGLKHASPECGAGDDGDSDDEGQEGAPWPLKPGDNEDEVEAVVQKGLERDSDAFDNGFGQLLGFGLDMRTTPYTILADGLHKVPEYYDFMTYCSVPGLGAAGDWVSPINWENVFHRFALASGSSVGGAQGSATASGAAARRKAHGPVATLHRRRLRVIAYATKAGVQIAGVGPQVGPTLPRGNSDYTLTVLGSHRQLLASVPMFESKGHVDHVGPLNVLTGELPARRVARVNVLFNGVVVASRSRPRHRPRLRTLAPRRGARVGGRRKVLVKWRTSGHKRSRLTASVDYSRDGGRHWRTIFVGRDRGHASLPAFYFAGSPRARVRVRVNDGFNEAVAVSGAFTSLGASPQVSIEKPLARIAGDARLQLSGQAVDQSMHVLGGKRLRWFDGRFPIGRGADVSAGPLPPGKNRIRLVATDPAGRTASANVTVKVSRVKLPFLKLGIPKSIPPAARRLVFRAKSAVRARLVIGKRSFKLKARRKAKLRIPVRRGVPLLLHLSVTANGVQTPFAVLVKRH